MSDFSTNDIFRKQQQRLVRSTFKKGLINAVHTASRTVDVTFAENPQSIIKNIPVASNVSITTVVAGQRCRVDIFDETNPQDSVMAFTY